MIMPFGIDMVGPVLYSFGSNEQKAQHLPKILDVFAETDGLVLDNSINHSVNQGDFVLDLIWEKP